MNVDTGEFAALRDQAADVAAIGRKVSALTGRVSVMGRHLDQLGGLVDDDIGIMIRFAAHLAGVDIRVSREPGRHAAPKGERHLRLIEGGRQ